MENSCCTKGFLYGLIPHAFCIAFILFSVIGAVSLTAIFKKILLIPYFFQILVAFSILMATISAVIYLKKAKCLCYSGIKNKWRYLVILYGTTIFINLLMFLFVFPALANINSPGIISGQTASLSVIVQIPCSGHAPLIIDELKKNPGVQKVIFKLPNRFDINYDPIQTSPDRIALIDIFKTYKLKVEL